MKPCLVLSHQVHARNWIASGMLDKMTRSGLIGTVVLPAALAQACSPQIPFGWEILPLEPWMATGARARTLEALRLGMLVSGARRGGLNYRLKVKAKRRLLPAGQMLGWRALSRVADPLPLIRRIGQALPAPVPTFPGGTHLILPTLIHEDVAQAGLVKAARRARVPVWAVPASWDNLVTKGAFFDPPDRLAVWGLASARHATEAHGFRLDQVTITGPPHFWPYGPTAQVSRLVMPMPITRYLVFAGTTVNFAADELHILTALVAALGRHAATKDIAVLYRPHPRRGLVQRDADVLKGFGVVMDPQWRGGWSLDPAQVPWIRTICEGALCTVSAFSTVVLESALCGTPSILIGFGDSAHGTGQALDHARYEHMAEMMNKPGIYVADTMTTLVETIKQMAAIKIHWGWKDAIRAWATEIADVDTDPRDTLIHWMKETWA